MPDSSYESMMLNSRSKVAELEAEREWNRGLLKRLVETWDDWCKGCPVPADGKDEFRSREDVFREVMAEAREELSRG
jgi:hypothetical protein